MKNLKNLLPLFALVLGLSLVIGSSAFKIAKKDLQQYQYTSNSHLAADIKDIENWEPVDVETPSCGLTGTLVCRYEFDGDMSDFQDFLEAPTTNATDINDNAISNKQ